MALPASFAPGTNLEAWLFTIMRNQFYNEHRKRGREVQDEDGAQAERMVSLPEQGGHLDLSDVRAALDRLAPRDAAGPGARGDREPHLRGDRRGHAVPDRHREEPVWRARTQLADLLGYTGLEVGSDEVMLAAAGTRGRRPVTVA